MIKIFEGNSVSSLSTDSEWDMSYCQFVARTRQIRMILTTLEPYKIPSTTCRKCRPSL